MTTDFLGVSTTGLGFAACSAAFFYKKKNQVYISLGILITFFNLFNSLISSALGFLT